MKRALILLFLAVSCIVANAGPFSGVDSGKDKKALKAILAKDENSKPATTFSADIPKIYAFWKGEGLKVGDKVKAVWIAEDVGEAAPKETKIDEVTMDVEKPDQSSAFSLSQPTKGWPVGKYRVEIFLGDDLAVTLKFTIEPA